MMAARRHTLGSAIHVVPEGTVTQRDGMVTTLCGRRFERYEVTTLARPFEAYGAETRWNGSGEATSKDRRCVGCRRKAHGSEEGRP